MPRNRGPLRVFCNQPLDPRHPDDVLRGEWADHRNCTGRIFGVYPGFPTLFWGLSVFFVGDLMGKACGSSWKTLRVFHGAVGAFCASTAPSASTGPVRVGQDASQGGGPCVMSSWTAASSDCSRPMNNYVHVKTADLYRPNARLTRKDRDIRYLRHLENSDIAGFLGRERIQLFDEFRYFFVDRRQKRINAELVHASGSMFGDVLEFQKIRLR